MIKKMKKIIKKWDWLGIRLKVFHMRIDAFVSNFY